MKQYFWEMPDKLEYRIKRIWEALEGTVHIKEIQGVYFARLQELPVQADYYPHNEGERLAYRQTLSILLQHKREAEYQNYEVE